MANSPDRYHRIHPLRGRAAPPVFRDLETEGPGCWDWYSLLTQNFYFFSPGVLTEISSPRLDVPLYRLVRRLLFSHVDRRTERSGPHRLRPLPRGSGTRSRHLRFPLDMALPN